MGATVLRWRGKSRGDLMALPSQHGLMLYRLSLRRQEIYRAIVVDANTDIGEWDDIVHSVESLNRSVSLDSIGVLGTHALMSPGEFLANAGAIHMANENRGRVCGPILKDIATRASAGARVLIVASGTVHDRNDWDASDVNLRPFPLIETSFESSNPRIRVAEVFLRGIEPVAQQVRVQASGWLRALLRDSANDWARGALTFVAQPELRQVEIEILESAEIANTSPGVTPTTWIATGSTAPELVLWDGPQWLSQEETSVLRHFVASEAFLCPRCGSDDGHYTQGSLSLRCNAAHQRRGFLLDRVDPWALDILEAKAEQARHSLSWLALRLDQGPRAQLWSWPLSLLPLDTAGALVRQRNSEWTLMGDGFPDLAEFTTQGGELIRWKESLLEDPQKLDQDLEVGGDVDVFLVARL